jgi:hypothetical protein
MDVNSVRQLAAIAARASSADNSQPWTFRWNGSELAIGFAPRHMAYNVFGPDSHATLLSVGAVAENLEAGLIAGASGGNWQWPSDPALGQPYVSLVLEDAAADFGNADGPLQRHTNRLAFRADSLPSALLKEAEHYRENSNRAVLLADRRQKSRLIRLVRLCSEARFCNQRLHEWLIGSLRFTPLEVERGDGLDIRTLGLPPGAKYFMRFISDWHRMKVLNKLGAHRLMALSETGLLRTAPALVCIVGQADARNVIDAGRLMTRIWTDLNLRGVAVQPYYVVTDQINRLRNGTLAPGFEAHIAEVGQEVRALLGLQSTEMLHMILRIGYPKADPVRSRRLPLAAIFVDASESAGSTAHTS